RSRRVAALPYDMPALFSGTAGRLRSHLMLWEETGDPKQLAAAIEAGEDLLHRAEDAGEGMLRWTVPPGYNRHSGRIYTGYAIGAAGIGDALLDLFEATGEKRFLSAAQAAAHWVKSLAMPTLNDDSGLDWP